MGKLVKNKYITTKGERKINCYSATIPKKIVEQVGLEDAEINVYAKGEQIIIEKKR